MTTYLLIPGAGGDPSVWGPTVDALRARGHRATAVDIPAQDESLGWEDYAASALAQLGVASDGGAEAVVGAGAGAVPEVVEAEPAAGAVPQVVEAEAVAGDGPEVVVVSLSMGAYVAPLLTGHVAVARLVLVNPMIPSPGESAGQWWEAVCFDDARRAAGLGELDEVEDFFHDVPAELRAQALAGEERGPSARSFAEPWPMDAWPEVSTVVVHGSDDRFFPTALIRRTTAERIGCELVEMRGGHLLTLSQPEALADVLEGLEGS